MESYAMVDNPVRKRMEDMLKTWKDPVPGSMDTRPVFSHELVRPIENALMRARAVSIPQNVMAGRGRGAMMPHRNTPTPPGGMRAYPPMDGQQPAYHQNGGQPAGQYQAQPPVRHPLSSSRALSANDPQANYYGHNTPQPGQVQGPYQTPPSGQYASGVAGTNVDKLNQDIQNLIVATQAEFSQNPHDASIQTRLKALMDLQGVLQTSTLPPDQLELIKNKVTELASVTRPTVAPSYAGQSLLPTRPFAGQFQQVTQPPAPSAAAPGGMSLDALLGQGALAALMARTGSNSNSTTPNPPGSAAIRSPPPPTVAQPAPPSAAAPNDAMSLLERLRSAGMLPPVASTPTPPVPAVPQAIPPPSLIPANIASILSAAKAGAFGLPNLSAGSLNDAMLKQQ